MSMKKSKGASTEVNPVEDVLNALADALDILTIENEIRSVDTNQFNPPPPCLRVPAKHFEYAQDIQQRVRKQTKSRLVPLPTSEDADSSEDELHQPELKPERAHPALLKVYNRIPAELSAFDRAQCETQAWTQKYAPECAAEVLQTGPEAELLREWLENLRITAVETGNLSSTPKKGRRGAGPKSDGPKKKKRKSNKMNGFIVSDDEEEEDDLDEITDPEGSLSPGSSQGTSKRTVVRSGDLSKRRASGKLSNAIVISGPHGSGKTAAAYAVAKELGFEVFEINASSRRSGKDITERVGDMTRNHQVQRMQSALVNSTDGDLKKIDEALQKDLKSGRQGTMNAFLKPQKPAPKPKKVAATAKPAKEAEQISMVVDAPEPSAKPVTQNTINSFFKPKQPKKPEAPVLTKAPPESAPHAETDKSKTTSRKQTKTPATKKKVGRPPKSAQRGGLDSFLGIKRAPTSASANCDGPADGAEDDQQPADAHPQEPPEEESNDVPIIKTKGSLVVKLKLKKGDSPKATPPPASPRKPKDQKQSLILLEEVDLLYKEDKDFWQTVMSMIAQSKRPVIMTCTDESVVPLQALTLHAIIRCQSPPTDLAVDYLLLVAANEGHIISRPAVKNLFEARGMDLRATLTELNFWCQVGVGSCKGGLDWIIPRWPPGCDKGSGGGVIRVVSEKTYQTGMGWLCADALHDSLSQSDLEEEVLHEAWNNWELDLGDWHDSMGLQSWASKLYRDKGTKTGLSNSLALYEDFVDTMSAADILGGPAIRVGKQIALDTTYPELSHKKRNDYLVGYPLLQADSYIDPSDLGLPISTSLKVLARTAIQKSIAQNPSTSSSLPPFACPSEPSVILKIARSKTPLPTISRHDFSIAFDPIALPPTLPSSTSSSLELSIFDRNFSLIALDIAPYIRHIVSYDAKLAEERAKLSNLLSQGGSARPGKRMRTTRAAMSALEGGQRRLTRKNKWFGESVNPVLVARTGGKGWREAVEMEMADEKEKLESASAEEASAKEEEEEFEMKTAKRKAGAGDGQRKLVQKKRRVSCGGSAELQGPVRQGEITA